MNDLEDTRTGRAGPAGPFLQAPRSCGWLIVALAPALSACGSTSAGGGGGGGGDGSAADPIAATLQGLGVDTTPTPRLDDDGNPLPDGYTPLGASQDFTASRELLVLGMPVGPASGFGSRMTVMKQVPDHLDPNGDPIYDTNVLFAPPAAATPWADAVASGALRAAARADLDRDGLDELVVVDLLPGASALELQIYDDKEAGFAALPPAPAPIALTGPRPREITVKSGDLDGDGRADLVIALSYDDRARLIFVRNTDGVLAADGADLTLPQTLAGSEVSVALATGNLDHDPADEVVAVVNEVRAPATGPATGSARYYVLDDADRGFAQLAAGPVRATSGALNRTAMVADVAIGDIDGDNLGEPIFAGLTHFDPGGDCDYRYLLVALDDLPHELAPIGAVEQDAGLRGLCRAGAPLELRYVHVNTLDVDGDGKLEIQANQFVYQSFTTSPPFTLLANTAIDPKSLFAYNQESGRYTGRFDRHTSAMVTGDLTGDERADVALYSQATHRLEVWGIGVPTSTWRMEQRIAVPPPTSAAAIDPVLLAPNVDRDSLVLKYDGEHRVVFTEPVVIAALAAAPCYADRGQELIHCRTSFGTAESTTHEDEKADTVTAGDTVGFSVEDSVFGVRVAAAEVLAKVQRYSERVRSKAYTLTRRIDYHTGPLEDTVIFTTIPYDQYSYTIRSHPRPELIGTRIVMSVPRSLIELQVSRDFYNANVRDGLKIDDAIFTHTAGDPHSYPTAGDRDRLIAGRSALAIGPRAVGQGSGNQTLTLDVYDETGSTKTYGVDYSVDEKATAGVIVTGFSVGVGEHSTLRIRHGEESSYAGTVANLPEAEFADHRYQFGLLTYVYQDPASGRQLEVLNYWVE